jgi:hypothetical protein
LYIILFHYLPTGRKNESSASATAVKTVRPAV